MTTLSGEPLLPGEDMSHRFSSAIALVTFLFVSATAVAQTDYRAEYDKKIKSAQDVGILGNGLAGDTFNFYTGATSFSATDLSLPGNNALPVSIGRSYSVETDRQLAQKKGSFNSAINSFRLRAFGDWDLDVPRITTTMTQAKGWVIKSDDASAVDPNNDPRRCSVLDRPNKSGRPGPAYVDGQYAAGTTFFPWEYWHGYSLETAQGSQSLLVASLPNGNRPSTGGPYHWTTNKNWWFSCIATLKNGGVGEGFLAIAPDGTKYRFDRLSRRDVEAAYEEQSQSPSGGPPFKTRRTFLAEYSLLPTRIEDRFGNFVDYTWSTAAYPQLTAITGSDGRTITLAYNAQGYVGSIFDGTRTVTYEYVNNSLSRVVLPDSSAWVFGSASQLGFIGLDNMGVSPDPLDVCDPVNQPPFACYGSPKMSGGGGAYVVHPSGARVDFSFGTHFQPPVNGSVNSTWRYPIGLLAKAISGPGLVSQTWQYAFSPTAAQAKGACEAGACPPRLWTDELGPDGSVSRRVFGLLDTQDQSLLVQSFEGEMSSGQQLASSPSALGSSAASTDVAKKAVVNPVRQKAIAALASPFNNWFDPTFNNSSIFSIGYYDNVTPVIYGSARIGEWSWFDDASAWNTFPVFLSEVDTVYVTPAEATAFPFRVGVDPITGDPFAQTWTSERNIAVKKQVTLQQNTAFRMEVSSFDAFGRPATVVESSSLGMSRTRTTTYFDHFGKWIVGQVKKTVVDGTEVTENFYDPTTALLTSTESFNKLQTSLAYNVDGTLDKVTDGRGKDISLKSWYRGLPGKIIYPTKPATPANAPNYFEAATINNIGNITSTTDELSYATSYTYDAVGRLASIIYPTADTVAWNSTLRSFVPVNAAEYNLGAGHWKQVVSTGNGRVTNYYDAKWRPVLTVTEDTAVAATKSFVVKRYDVMGRESFRSYAVSALTDIALALDGIYTSYDPLGRVKETRQKSELGDLVTTIKYIDGFKTQVTNPRGKVTTTNFQAFDSPSTESPLGIALPAGVSTAIVRDVFGKAKSITRSGIYAGNALSATRYYVYDANQLLCETIDPEAGTTILAYDGANNVIWSADGTTSSGLTAATCTADRGNVELGSANRTVRAYDDLNRVLTVNYPDAINDTTYAYDPDGALKTLVSNGSTWTYGYNKRRLLENESLNFYGPYPIARTYDANGNLSVITSPNGTAVAYAPNALGQATQAGSYATGVKYYADGALKEFSYGNGMVHSMVQNTRHLPMRSLDVKGAVEALDDNYSFDANGNVLTIVDDNGSGLDTTRGMAYDDLDRLTTVVSSGVWGTAAYSYDPLDNLRTNTLGMSGLTYIYDTSNKLTRLDRSGGGSYNYTYDPRGNVSNDGRNAYNFTRANRLAGISGKDSYQYDGNGRRVVVWRANGSAQVPVYGQDGVLRYIADNNSGGGTTPIYLAGSQIAESFWNWTTGVTAVKYVHTDALGSPVAKSDAAGNPLPEEAIVYAPYGAPINRPVDGQGYTGHVMDMSSGLIYMQQRYYDPGVGRFLGNDPVSTDPNTGASFNRYWYADNNPYKFTDPDGRQPQDGVKPPSTGIPYFDWLMAPSDAQDSTSQVIEKQVRVELSQPHSAEDVVLLTGVAISLGTGSGGLGREAGGLVSKAPGAAARTAGELFFDGAKLSDRVVGQMKTDALHGFSRTVDGFAARDGVVKKVLDKRGKPVQMLTVRGGLGKREGTFEYIKNQANVIYHRYFKADR